MVPTLAGVPAAVSAAGAAGLAAVDGHVLLVGAALPPGRPARAVPAVVPTQAPAPVSTSCIYLVISRYL